MLALSVWLLASSTATAEDKQSLPPSALHAIRHIAIQHQGRVKPFDSFARETLDRLTGAPRWQEEDPVATVLSLVIQPDRWNETPVIAVSFRPLREAIGMPPRATHVSYSELVATKSLMRMLPPIVAKQQRDEKLTMLENETMDVYDRFVTLNALWQQELALVPPPQGEVWSTILNAVEHPAQTQQAVRQAWTSLVEAAQGSDAEAVTAAASHLAQTLRAANPSAYPADWRLRLEVAYNQATPFRIARWLYLLAAALLLSAIARPSRWASAAGFTALVAAFLVHVAGIATRVTLGGRPPVANFYETMLWLPFVAVLLSLIFERVYHVRYFGFSAALLAGIVLVLADHLPLDPSLTPIVAVLRSNLWLTIHVLTIVASYGALALATILAHVYGWQYVREARLVKREASKSQTVESSSTHGASRTTLHDVGFWLYRAIQVGVVLLAAGIMLGAVWANASWGRYWGWDPKETWALITLLWFLAMLHGRFAGWVSDVGLALGTIGGFFLLLMTYYGVSFYLVGLHSYAGGNAKPIPPLLIAYFVAEVAWMGLVGWRAFRDGAPAARRASSPRATGKSRR